MKLKEHVDMAAFLDATAKCAGDVFFHSADGDILNLKSLLSQYILVSIVCNPGLLEMHRLSVSARRTTPP